MKDFKPSRGERITAKSIEEDLEKVYEALEEAKKLAVPMIDKMKLKKSNEWFNESLRRLRNKVAKSKRKFYRKKSERNLSLIHI